MANHKSALKRIRQTAKRNARNRFAKATIRTKVKGALAAIEAGEKEQATTLAKEATRLMDKAVVHGLLHRNNASRRIGRLQRKVASLG